MTVDGRSLGLFRVAFGLLLLANVARHFTAIDDFLTDDGVLPATWLLDNWPAVPLSLFLFATTKTQVVAGLVGCGLVYLGYTLGRATRLFQLLAVIATISLHCRAPMIEHAGERVLNTFVLLTLFLPLGKRFSLDAALASRRNGSGVYSISYVTILLQIGGMYFSEFAGKTGANWHDGTALYYVVHDGRVTWIVNALRAVVPAFVYKATTWGSLGMEGVIPILVLAPYRPRFARSAAVLVIVVLHAGILSILSLGVFQPAMIIVALLLVQPEDWELAKRKLPHVAALADRIRQRLAARRPVQTSLAAPRRAIIVTNEVLASALGLWMVTLLWVENPAYPQFFDQSTARVLADRANDIGISQAWRHYADPKGDMVVLVVDAVTADGRHVDPAGEKAYGHKGPPIQRISSGVRPSLFWYSYTRVFKGNRRPPILPALVDWILRYHERTGRAEDRILRFDIHLLMSLPPPFGHPDEAPLERRRTIFSYTGPTHEAIAP